MCHTRQSYRPPYLLCMSSILQKAGLGSEHSPSTQSRLVAAAIDT